MITSNSISGSNVTLVGSAEANATINVYDGGSALVGAVEANSSGAWTLTTGSLSTGAHAFTATATDGAGNTSVASQAVDPVIGGAPPAPTINSASPDASGDPVVNGNVLTLHGTAQANSPVDVFDGTTNLGTTSVGADGAWTFVTSQLATGVHQFAAVDAANGGTSSASTVLDVTTEDPTVTLTELTHVTQLAHKTNGVALFSGTSEPLSTITIYADGSATHYERSRPPAAERGAGALARIY